MRKWTVEGTDYETGEPRGVVVNAQDEAGAEQVARLQGLTPTRVYVYDPGDTSDVTLEKVRQAVDGKPLAYARRTRKDSLSGAVMRLNAADFILSIAGWLYVIVAVFALGAIPFIFLARGRDAVEYAVPLLTLGVGCASAGILFLGAGAAFRVIGSIGLSTATMARNAGH